MNAFRCDLCTLTKPDALKISIDGPIFVTHGHKCLPPGTYCKHCLLGFLGASPNDFPLPTKEA